MRSVTFIISTQSLTKKTSLYNNQNKTFEQSGNMSTYIKGQCRISMLWNWYTIDSCFLASSWHVKSKGMFAGTCIGTFVWIVAYIWFHRILIEYDQAVVQYKLEKYKQDHEETHCCCTKEKEEGSDSSLSEKKTEDRSKSTIIVNNRGDSLLRAITNVCKHNWLFSHPKHDKGGAVLIYPSLAEHSIKSFLYMIEWACSFLIMLMWMYYNGYIIIVCILGYFVGELLFNYAPIATIENKRYIAPQLHSQTEC